MDKIDINEIINIINEMRNEKITLLITSFKEPNIYKAINAALNQKTDKDYEIVISTPDNEVIAFVKKISKIHKNINILKDPGRGKSFALNLAFSTLKTDILILTDGDVLLGPLVIEEISKSFYNPEIGCVSGHPIPIEKKNTKFGFWANFLFEAAHRIRKEADKSNSFLECSGYLFAFRKNKLTNIPVDVAEDSIIPYYLWQKGYKIGYAEKAEVYVKNTDNLRDWVKQKIRTNKSHQNLDQYADTKTTPKVKSFITETKGIFWALRYSKNSHELFWIIQLILARFYVWARYFIDIKILDKNYSDGWEKAESTR